MSNVIKFPTEHVRSCMMCGKKPAPRLWWPDCDGYLCEGCFEKQKNLLPRHSPFQSKPDRGR